MLYYCYPFFIFNDSMNSILLLKKAMPAACGKPAMHSAANADGSAAHSKTFMLFSCSN